ncbi:LOW QUALITY PROTEIN: ell-associated factor Eaf [Drosophila tropicalis]|uniref:LOW QUALITY PROTEIN: ell-associated factor Eaf n=1 Tax=Drosophila tropicalis TaxID=46794 RepID=UPI0035AB7E82
MMMTKQKNTLADRLNISGEVRELRLGATFNPKNSSTAFHTIKYDFKPASVDPNRMAAVDVGSNNQVTVTVPNLENSGVPHTVYKGNQRKYAKECLMIYDKETGAITLEKLYHNIQVKKTRSEMTHHKPSFLPAPNINHNNIPMSTNGSGPGPGPGSGPSPPSSGSASGSGQKLENSTMRISSKTKVSTGSRRNNIIDFKPRNSPMQQSSPSRPVASHRSPQSAPAWNANNAQQTLPSIPMIMDDDDFGLGAALHNGTGGGQANISGSSTGSSTGQSDYGGGGSSSSSTMHRQRQVPQHGQHGKRQQMHQHHQQHPSPPMHQQQQQQQHYGRGINNGGGSNNYAQQQQPPQQQQHHQQQQRPSSSSTYSHHSNNMPMDLDSPREHELTSQTMAQAGAAIEEQIGGVLSASSSSSESDSSDSDSGSDSDDSTDDDSRPMQQQQLPNLGLGSISPSYNNHQQVQQQPQQQQQQQHHHHHMQQQHHHQQQQQQQSDMYTSNRGFPNDLLQNDLQLSSNSSDDDDD